MSRKTLAMVVRALIVLFVVVLSVIIFIYFFKLFFPFIIATFLVVLINPIINFLERKARFPRVLAVLTTLLLFFSAFAGIMTLLIAEIIAGSAYLAAVIPDKFDVFITNIQKFFTEKILPFYEGIASKFSTLDTGKQDTISESIKEASSKLSGSVTTFLQDFLTSLPALVSWIPGAATAIVFILLATFFISKDWKKLSEKVRNQLPTVIKSRSGAVLKDLRKSWSWFY